MRAITIVSLALSVAAAPPGWIRGERASADVTLDLLVALRQSPSSLAMLEAELLRVSDPASPSYSAHLSQADVSALLAPAPGAAEAAAAWLSSAGVSARALPHGYFKATTVPVAVAEALLGCTYYEFSHTATGTKVHRCSSAPTRLPAGAVDFVQPTTTFPAVRGAARAKRVGASAGGVTPAAIRDAYGIPAADVNTVPGLQQMAAGFLGEFVALPDLRAFQSAFDPAGTTTPFDIVGPNVATQPGVEAMLDVEYIIAMGQQVNTTFWYTDGTRPSDNEPFLDFLTNVSASFDDATLPRVLSISYGDNEDTIDLAWGTRVHVEFQALGARGMSVLISSGDGGVAGSQTSPCGTPPAFIPTFPAGLPSVTAVGATTSLGAGETAVGFSSGGFSNYWARPSWQAAAAASYLANTPGLPAASYFNQTGAGIPDIAAIGTNFNIVSGGSTFQVDGTSCSAPTTAGIISLLNAHRLAAGKAALGFLNPLIYSDAGRAAFADITTGSNPGCGTKGFPATKGWDPVTGMGRPDYTKLLALVMSLP